MLKYSTLVLFLFFSFFSCTSDDNNIPIENSDIDLPLNQSSNIKRLVNKDTLKILAIGNSFTEDLYSYVPNITREMDIDNIVLAEVTYSGCSLSQHNSFYNNQSNVYSFNINNGIGVNWDTQTNVTLKYALQYTDWDIVILQQASYDSGIYSSFQPFLNNLIHIIYKNVTNKKIVFAWHSTWAYATNSTHGGFWNYNRDQTLMYNGILDATQNVSKDTGINLIIPTGKVIQNLRATSLNNNGLDLTRDGYHLDLGVGRYSASSTFIKAIILPLYPSKKQEIPFIDIKDNPNSIHLTRDNYKICLESIDKAFNDK